MMQAQQMQTQQMQQMQTSIDRMQQSREEKERTSRQELEQTRHEVDTVRQKAQEACENARQELDRAKQTEVTSEMENISERQIENDVDGDSSVGMQDLSAEEKQMAIKKKVCLRFLMGTCHSDSCKLKHYGLGWIRTVMGCEDIEIKQSNSANQQLTMIQGESNSPNPPEIAESKFKKGFILKSFNGRVGTVWKDPESEGGTFRYILCMRSVAGQEISMYV